MAGCEKIRLSLVGSYHMSYSINFVVFMVVYLVYKMCGLRSIIIFFGLQPTKEQQAEHI
jgi:hypothetical protein